MFPLFKATAFSYLMSTADGLGHTQHPSGVPSKAPTSFPHPTTVHPTLGSLVPTSTPTFPWLTPTASPHFPNTTYPTHLTLAPTTLAVGGTIATLGFWPVAAGLAGATLVSAGLYLWGNHVLSRRKKAEAQVAFEYIQQARSKRIPPPECPQCYQKGLSKNLHSLIPRHTEDYNAVVDRIFMHCRQYTTLFEAEMRLHHQQGSSFALLQSAELKAHFQEFKKTFVQSPGKAIHFSFLTKLFPELSDNAQYMPQYLVFAFIELKKLIVDLKNASPETLPLVAKIFLQAGYLSIDEASCFGKPSPQKYGFTKDQVSQEVVLDYFIAHLILRITHTKADDLLLTPPQRTWADKVWNHNPYIKVLVSLLASFATSVGTSILLTKRFDITEPVEPILLGGIVGWALTIGFLNASLSVPSQDPDLLIIMIVFSGTFAFQSMASNITAVSEALDLFGVAPASATYVGLQYLFSIFYFIANIPLGLWYFNSLLEEMQFFVSCVRKQFIGTTFLEICFLVFSLDAIFPTDAVTTPAAWFIPLILKLPFVCGVWAKTWSSSHMLTTVSRNLKARWCHSINLENPYPEKSLCHLNTYLTAEVMIKDILNECFVYLGAIVAGFYFYVQKNSPIVNFFVSLLSFGNPTIAQTIEVIFSVLTVMIMGEFYKPALRAVLKKVGIGSKIKCLSCRWTKNKKAEDPNPMLNLELKDYGSDYAYGSINNLTIIEKP